MIDEKDVLEDYKQSMLEMNSNLKTRILVAFLYFPFLLCSAFDSRVFTWMIGILLVLAWHEYLSFQFSMPTTQKEWGRHFTKITLGALPLLLALLGCSVWTGWVLLLFGLELTLLYFLYQKRELLWMMETVGFYLLGLLYLTLPMTLLVLSQQYPSGHVAIWFLLFVVGITDVGAYFVGKSFGRRSFFQNISPSKTVEGVVGGVLSSFLFSILFYFVFKSYDFTLPPFLVCVGLGLIISIVGVFGDLFESLLKRFYGLKDSGRLVPGHGGVLDRFDSIFFGCIPLFVYLFLRGGFQ